MMIEPSIDAMISKAENNRYILANVIAQRARQIEREGLQTPDKKAITMACEELMTGKLQIMHEGKE